MSDISEPATVVFLECDNCVLSEDLPGWAESESTGREHGASDDSNTGNWIETALTGVDTPAPETPESVDPGHSDAAATSGLEVTVCRTACESCGQRTVRRVHNGCQAPIIRLDSTWRCGRCGVEVTQAGNCSNCGGTQKLEPVTIPLALEIDLRPRELERAIHEATNDRRIDKGLDRLEYSNPISAIALQHSRDMAQRGYFSHNSPEGEDVSDRYRTYGHQARQCGENLAKVFPAQNASLAEAAREVVDAWMNSPGHRENLLRERFEREGIGVYFTQTGAVYATQNFD